MIGRISRILQVIRTRAVTGFAAQLLLFIPRIDPKGIRVDRVRELLVLRCVTGDTNRLTHVLRAAIQGRGRRRCHGRLGLGENGGHEHARGRTGGHDAIAYLHP